MRKLLLSILVVLASENSQAQAALINALRTSRAGFTDGLHITMQFRSFSLAREVLPEIRLVRNRIPELVNQGKGEHPPLVVKLVGTLPLAQGREILVGYTQSSMDFCSRLDVVLMNNVSSPEMIAKSVSDSQALLAEAIGHLQRRSQERKVKLQLTSQEPASPEAFTDIDVAAMVSATLSPKDMSQVHHATDSAGRQIVNTAGLSLFFDRNASPERMSDVLADVMRSLAEAKD